MRSAPLISTCFELIGSDARHSLDVIALDHASAGSAGNIDARRDLLRGGTIASRA